MQAAMSMPLQHHQWLLPFLALKTHVAPYEEPAGATCHKLELSASKVS